MKELPTNDKLFGEGTVHADGRKDPLDVPGRAEDARGIQGLEGLLQDPRDYPSRRGVPPASEGDCPLVNR
jgi:hypothetical protein